VRAPMPSRRTSYARPENNNNNNMLTYICSGICTDAYGTADLGMIGVFASSGRPVENRSESA
jgi:hypothetical protein